jgi:hypothetical protein
MKKLLVLMLVIMLLFGCSKKYEVIEENMDYTGDYIQNDVLLNYKELKIVISNDDIGEEILYYNVDYLLKNEVSYKILYNDLEVYGKQEYFKDHGLYVRTPIVNNVKFTLNVYGGK